MLEGKDEDARGSPQFNAGVLSFSLSGVVVKVGSEGWEVVGEGEGGRGRSAFGPLKGWSTVTVRQNCGGAMWMERQDAVFSFDGFLLRDMRRQVENYDCTKNLISKEQRSVVT